MMIEYIPNAAVSNYRQIRQMSFFPLSFIM